MDPIEIIGIGSANRRARVHIRILSTTLDIICVLSLYAWTLYILNITPLPSIMSAMLLILVSFAYWLPQKIWFQITLGERIWHLTKRSDSEPNQVKEDPKYYERDHLGLGGRFLGFLGNLGVLGALGASVQLAVVSHPVWTKTPFWDLKALSSSNPPDHAPKITEQFVAPFFYQLGIWPTRFQNRPTFYSLNYEIGPPKKFIGKVTLTLQNPDTILTIEGPKTPHQSLTRDEIRNCFLNPESTHTLNAFGCAFKREHTLARHLKNMARLEGAPKWFQVRDSKNSDETQGIYLKSVNLENNRTQERFVFINSSGAHQALILDRPNTPAGDSASLTALETVRSIRNFPDLTLGRAWINQSLESVRLEELIQLKDPTELATQLARIQSLLIAKISVEPGSIDPYFHLAGTSLLLLTHPLLKNDVLPGSPIKTSSFQNLQSALLFSKDIAPNDRRILQIETMLANAKKSLSEGY